MGLLDAYQDSTDRALTVMAARPIDPEPPKPKHSGWSTIPRAVAGAFVETAGNIMDVASAYGQVQAATGANANPLIPDSPEDRKQRLEAFDKLKTDGIDWQPEESRPHYQMARDLRPDPITAGAAENIVFGLTKGLTKAIGAGMIAGPVAGAGAFGVSEGMTTAEDLAAQGVDPATRQKVGVVTGAMSAAGMALPVAGSTLAKTAALVAVGGPASFVAQQAATRAILENADYGKLAQQYDPLDPVGLALATLLPAGFATLAKAGAISAAMKGKPKAAADPVPMTPEPIRPTATQDQVDAAMVHNLTIARDAHDAVPIETVQAALAPVKVGAGDTAPIDRSPAADPWNEPRTLEQRIADEIIRAELLRMKGETGWAEVGGRMIRENGDDGEVTGRTAWVPNAEWWPGRPKGLKEFEVKVAIDKAIAGEKLKAAERRIVEYMADVAEQRRKSEAWKPTSDDLAEYGLTSHNELDVAMTARAAEIDEGRVEQLATQFESDDAGFMRGIKELLDEHDRQTAASRQEGQRAPDATAAGQSDPGTSQQAEAVTPPKAADPHITSILSRVEALKAQSPDLPVALREDGTPVTLAEELDAIRRQAREGTADTFGADDAPLIQVAVECMLSMGAA